MDIVLRATVMFFILFLLIRLLGKRELGQMTPFELVVLVVLGGVSFRNIAGLIAGGFLGLSLAYAFYDNARHRIDKLADYASVDF